MQHLLEGRLLLEEDPNFNVETLRCSTYLRPGAYYMKYGKYRSTHGEGLKVINPKEMLQTLPIALAQAEASNTSENLLKEIYQIIYLILIYYYSIFQMK